MTEQTVSYLLNTRDKPATMDAQMHTLRADLEVIERRLINALIVVQQALGKEPTVMTRAERRRG